MSLISLLTSLVFICLFLSRCGGNGYSSTGNLPIVSLTQSGNSKALSAGASAVSLTASVLNDPLNRGVTWTMNPTSGCGTLTAAISTAIYSPPASLTGGCSVTITATSVADSSSNASIVFSVSQVVSIKVSVTQSGSSTTIAAGNPPVTLTASVTGDSANAGVSWSLSPSSGCGTLTSTGLTATYTPPAESLLNSNCSATPKATSVTQSSSSDSLAFTVNPVALVLSAGESKTPTAAAQGSPLALSASLVNDASGSATINWTVGGGSSCGSLSGSPGPSVTLTPPTNGPCQATLTAATSVNPNVNQIFTIKVNAPLAITTTSLTGGSSGQAYSATLQTNQGGIPPYSWQATNLPTGLMLSADGVLSGTPTGAAGSYNPSFAVTDSDSHPRTVQQNLPLVIALTLSDISPNSGQAGVTSIALTGNGFPAGIPASPSNVQITLTPAGGGSPLNITPSTVTALGGGISRLAFQLPGAAGTGPATPTLYNVSLNDTTDGISSGTPGNPQFTENPAASLKSLNPNSGFQGATNEVVTISGSFTNFVQGTTQANFGAGITVNSLTVNSPTSATANLSIAANATTGGRSITISSDIQSETANFTVNPASTNTSTVSGQVKLVNGSALAGATLDLGGGLTGTTDASGNYSITGVPTGGSFTLTPSFSMPAGDSAVFYPASQNITVSGDLGGQNFSAQLGFTVSGTVSYHGTQNKQGQAYIKLQIPNCAGCSTQGTSVELISRGATSVTQPFTIHGVPPGSYSGQAFYDLIGFDMQNIADPVASPVSVVVTNADVTAISFPMTDPSTTGNVSPASPDVPLNMIVSPIDNGVAIYYPSVKIGGVEQALGYNVNWSFVSPSDCQSPSPSFGGGLNVKSNSTLWEDTGNVVFLDGNNQSNQFFRLSPVSHKPAHGQTWFFCVQGVDGHGNGGSWYTVNGTSNTAAQVVLGAAPGSNAANTSEVTMNVTIPASTPFTGNGVNLTGPLYTGCYDRGSHIFNVVSDQNSDLTLSQPGNTTSYNVFSVPNGSNCSPFAWVDQDNDGVALANQPYAATAAVPYALSGDLFNFGRSNVVVPISAATSQAVDLTGFSEQSVASLITQSFASFTDQNNVLEPQSYAVNFKVQPLVAQPGTVQLQAPSPNVNSLMDFAAVNHGVFTMSLSTSTVEPQNSDNYALLVTPLNSSLPADFWGTGSSTCLGAACPLEVSGVNTSFATGLSASGSGTPTFHWGNGSGLVSQFAITDTNGNVIWQVLNIPSSTTSLTWPTDPTGAGQTAPTPTLASGTYVWSITTVDSNGNLATQKQVHQQP